MYFYPKKERPKMRPGELILRCGDGTRSFLFTAPVRHEIQEDLGCTPFVALQRGMAPANFNVKMGNRSYQGTKDRKFSALNIVNWFDGIKSINGVEVGDAELAVEFLYAFARSRTGKEAEEEIESIEEVFGHLLVTKEGVENPSQDG